MGGNISLKVTMDSEMIMDKDKMLCKILSLSVIQLETLATVNGFLMNFCVTTPCILPFNLNIRYSHLLLTEENSNQNNKIRVGR